MAKPDAEKDALLALVLKYEACYEDIKKYTEEKFPDSDTHILRIYFDIMHRLDDTFGTKEKRDD